MPEKSCSSKGVPAEKEDIDLSVLDFDDPAGPAPETPLGDGKHFETGPQLSHDMEVPAQETVQPDDPHDGHVDVS